MDCFKPPPPLALDVSNLGDAWRRWRQLFELFLEASGQSSESIPESKKVAILLRCAGEAAVEVYNTFTFSDPTDSKNLDSVCEKFEEYCNPRTNVVYERHRFWETRQQEGQPFDQYVTELRMKARSCSFVETENMFQDHIVFAMSDLRLKERLIHEKELDLTKAVDICRAAETSHAQLKTMTKTPLEVNEMRSFRKQDTVPGRAYAPRNEHRSSLTPEGPPTTGTYVFTMRIPEEKGARMPS